MIFSILKRGFLMVLCLTSACAHPESMLLRVKSSSQFSLAVNAILSERDLRSPDIASEILGVPVAALQQLKSPRSGMIQHEPTKDIEIWERAGLNLSFMPIGAVTSGSSAPYFWLVIGHFSELECIPLADVLKQPEPKWERATPLWHRNSPENRFTVERVYGSRVITVVIDDDGQKGCVEGVVIRAFQETSN